MTAANDNPITQLRAIQARIDELRSQIRAEKFAVHILCELYEQIEQQIATNIRIERQLGRSHVCVPELAVVHRGGRRRVPVGSSSRCGETGR